MKSYQTSRKPKTRWSGFLTTENHDWLCRIAVAEDRSTANVLNRVLNLSRGKDQNGDCSTWKSDTRSNQK